MFRPGHTVSERTHGPGSEYHRAKQEAKQRRAPFAQFEIDYAIAERLKERMDVPETGALDRLTLLARRVVADAIAGRPYAQEAIMDRLQPKRVTREDVGRNTGVVVVTQVVGPQGQEFGARTHDRVLEASDSDSDE